MTNTELKALRRFFFLDVADASKYIGNCSPRAWQYWESGSRAIPDDVIVMMNQLKEERKEILSNLYNNGTFADLKSKGFLYERLIESVKAELLSKDIK